MKKEDITLYSAVVLFLVGLYFLWPATKPHGNSSHPSLSTGPNGRNPIDVRAVKRKIDQHLKMGRFSEELRRELTAIENQTQAPSIDLHQIDPFVYAPEKPLPIRLQGEKAAANALKDGSDEDFYSRYYSLTPDQRISRKINRDEWAREREQEVAEAFLREYIENARRAGFDVRLNSKGEIVEVIDIETEEPMRFPQSVGDSVKKATPQSSR